MAIDGNEIWNVRCRITSPLPPSRQNGKCWGEPLGQCNLYAYQGRYDHVPTIEIADAELILRYGLTIEHRMCYHLPIHDEVLRDAIASSNNRQRPKRPTEDDGAWLVGCEVICDLLFRGFWRVQRLYPLPKPAEPQGLTLDWEYGLRQVDDGKQCQFNFTR